jgi:hypothetical protein
MKVVDSADGWAIRWQLLLDMNYSLRILRGETNLSQGDADFWEVANIHQRFMKRKLCLAERPDDPCQSAIIQAHTIPRSQLEKISVEGHVFGFQVSFADLQKGGGRLTEKKIGIRQFSTLNCFCRRHDNALFVDIEDVPLIFTERQIALLHYRAVASELYKKIRNDEANSHHLDQLVKSSKKRLVREKIDFLKAYAEGTKLGLRDARRALEDCEKILADSSYEQLSACVALFSELPNIMAVGGFYPEFDYNGRTLQQLGLEQTLAQTLSFNILASEGRAAVAFIWRKGDSHCLSFVESYSKQPSKLLTTLAIQTSFEHLENTCMNPTWWEAAKPIERKMLTDRMQVSGSPMAGRDRRCLEFSGISYDDWGFDSLRFINI